MNSNNSKPEDASPARGKGSAPAPPKRPHAVKGLRRWFTLRRTWHDDKRTPRAPYGTSHKLSLAVGFEPRDLWVGLYWTRRDLGGSRMWFVCPLPCVVLRVHHRTSVGGRFPRKPGPLGISLSVPGN